MKLGNALRRLVGGAKRDREPDLPRGSFSVRRGLAAFEERFRRGFVAEALASGRTRVGPVRALEIGCGEGHLLMDLCRLAPAAELHGINKRPWEAMRGSASLRDTARYYRIFDDAELRGLKLPEIHFYSAEELRFPDAHFDLVLSQVAIHYVPRKDRLLEEVWRVLKPGGRAYLHVDSRQPSMPDFLSGATPRFRILRGGALVPLAEFVAARAAQGFAIEYEENGSAEGEGRRRACLVLEKSRADPLALGLEFDAPSSFNLFALQQQKGDKEVFFGYRSVYRIAGPGP